MTDDIEMAEDAILVRKRGEGFERVPVPAGVAPLHFRNAVASTQTWWLAKGVLPTAEDLYSIWAKTPKETYAVIMASPEFAVALGYRGIQWGPDNGLSIEQQTVLLKLADPTDRRKLSVKLRDLGIPMPTYQSWLRQPMFRRLLNERTKSMYEDYLPEVRGALVGKAIDGDMQAVSMVMAITGEWDPHAREVQNAREVVLKVMDTVIKNVQDVDLRRKILADVQAAVVGFDVQNALEA